MNNSRQTTRIGNMSFFRTPDAQIVVLKCENCKQEMQAAIRSDMATGTEFEVMCKTCGKKIEGEVSR